MPRLNVGRSVQVEANLARRIAHERERRGQSYEALAEAMTKAGCAIAGSSIYKIEKGTPPRRVSVDELVTLAQVWDLPVEDLLTPMELLEQRRAHELIEALQRNQRNMYRLAADVFAVFLELAPMIERDSDLLSYVRGHYAANPTGLSGEDFREWGQAIAALVGYADDSTPHREVAFLRVVNAGADFHSALFKAAGLLAAGDAGELDGEEDQARLRDEIEAFGEGERD